jgi:hypothetical protein
VVTGRGKMMTVEALGYAMFGLAMVFFARKVFGEVDDYLESKNVSGLIWGLVAVLVGLALAAVGLIALVGAVHEAWTFFAS